ncbi:MAG: hypothetical protein ABIU29_06470, partial [Chthoniobacterales bacterium]
ALRRRREAQCRFGPRPAKVRVHVPRRRQRGISWLRRFARSSGAHRRLIAAIGSLIGLAFALTGARLLKSFLYGVSTSDPITFTFIAFLLLTTPSSLLNPRPPRHRVDPMIALRAE